MADILFDRLCLVGIGLIGSSLSNAMRKQGLARTIVGHAQSEKTRETALRLGLVSSVYATAAEAVKGADLIILCVPIGACGPIAKEIEPVLSPGAILTDVGSVKGAVLRDVGPHVPKGVHFIPGHPIAGTEHSGPEAGFAELFDGRWCVLTPPSGADKAAVDKLVAFWKALGSHVEVMEVSNQSTGSWPAVATALDGIGVSHPGPRDRVLREHEKEVSLPGDPRRQRLRGVPLRQRGA